MNEEKTKAKSQLKVTDSFVVKLTGPDGKVKNAQAVAGSRHVEVRTGGSTRTKSD